MGREGRNHTIFEEKAWYYAFTSTDTPINPLFIKYSLNSHFRTKYCAQDLKFFSPTIKKLVKILIFSFNLHVEFEKVAATGGQEGAGEGFGNTAWQQGSSASAGEGLQSLWLTARASEIQGALMCVTCLLSLWYLSRPWRIKCQFSSSFLIGIDYRKRERDLNWPQASRMLLRNAEV